MKQNLINLLIVIFMTALSFISCNKKDLPKTLAKVEIADIIIGDTSLICSIRFLTDGNDEIIAKGVCWSTTKMPIINNNRTTDGAGKEDYQSIIEGLIQTGVYYVRPYAENSICISYGDIIKVQTLEGDGKQIIDYDGNIYNTVEIGNQIWSTKNSYATHFQNGDNIYENKDAELYETDLSNDSLVQPIIYGIKNTAYYGTTFTWEKVVDKRNICPKGWHPANNEDWQQLITTLGGPINAGAKMKEVGIEHWHKPNVGATNESGFTALPGGYNNSIWVGLYAFWWSAGQEYDSTNAYGWFLKYDEIEAYNFYANKKVGMTVRCVKDIN
ncbi:MAG: hypothetical protein C0598_14350 [Marinilabiliales bacterium]|nr:MAG: hypothetical protein C0598_14350 [Marinilabiliales bacterium]